ncbi:thiopeptide-type bacteriocin biosynthesis protein [Streptomyces zhihengii]
MTEPTLIQRAVAAALTGPPIPDVAAQHGIAPTTLADAVAVYDQAGREALARHASTVDWWQVYLHFTDWTKADETFTAHVLPLLQEAETDGLISGWWYTRKHPCWRLRLRIRSAPPALDNAMPLLLGPAQRWAVRVGVASGAAGFGDLDPVDARQFDHTHPGQRTVP